MNLLAFLPKRKQPVSNPVNNPFLYPMSDLESKVQSILFPSNSYTLLEHTLAPARLHDDRQSCANPAFKFLDQSTGKSFWLEVKSCSEDWSHHIHWCTEMQLRRYLSCHKKTPTFLLLDIQHRTNAPHALYLLSMTQARYPYLLDSCIRHFEIPANQALLPAQLWSR